jgi:hypothetical protein
MYKLLLFLLCLSLSAFSLQAQEQGYSPKDSLYYQHVQRTEVLFDNFDDDRNEWIGIPNQPKGTVIRDGFFTIARSDTSAWGIQLPFNSDRDFEIECVAGVRNGHRRGMAGIEWGKACGVGYNQLGFCRETLQFRVDEFGTKVHAENSYKSTLPKQDFYKYSIRKVGENYYFFVNEHFIFTCPFKQLIANGLFFCQNKTNLIVDKVRVSYLN